MAGAGVATSSITLSTASGNSYQSEGIGAYRRFSFSVWKHNQPSRSSGYTDAATARGASPRTRDEVRRS